MVNRSIRLRVCEYCSKEFQTTDYKKKFCNHSCSAKFNNVLRVKAVKESAKSLIQKWLDGEWDGTVKSGLSSTIRRFLLEEAGYKCSECSWSGINPVSGKTTLTVDHIDGNSSNNKKENLKVLCPNCHSLTPTYGALNKGNGRKTRYGVVA